MSRNERQVQELRVLCAHGSLSRAVDLAFQHFADFGRNEEVLAFIAAAIDQTPVANSVLRRFADLQESHRDGGGQDRSAGGQRPGAVSSSKPPTNASRKGTPHVQ